MKRVAIVGASGFVGTQLCEHLRREGHHEVVPIIHTSGSAWRLARWGMPFKVADLLDRNALALAIDGCTHVVNCSRGDDRVMLRGLENVLECSARAGVQGFVHLSSVLVYGDPPSPDSVAESAALPRLTGYGAIKARQDEIVARHASRVPSVILCPPNIGGPYSLYLLGLVEALRTRRFALMDSGDAPCVLVDVCNLAHAIELSLDRGSNAPRRLFVTDDEPVTWGMLVAELQEIGGIASIRSISQTQLRALRAHGAAPVHVSPIASMKHLMSGEVRQVLRRDPLLARIDAALRGIPAMLGTRVEERLRLAIGGTPPIPRLDEDADLNLALTSQQLRGVRHSPAAARQEIGYSPLHSFSASMRAFGRWYRRHTGRDSSHWPLLARL
jgi:nucleoside-diphosphate-sugar epimerase